MKARGVLGNAGWNAFGTLFNIATAFLLAPLLIHRLGVDEWGLLLLVWSVTGVLSLANFGLGEATLRYVAHYYADRDLVGINRVLGSSLTYYVSVSALVIAAVWAGTPLFSSWIKVPEELHDTLQSLLRLTPLLFAAGILTNAFRAIPMALHRYDINSALGSTLGFVRSAGLLLLVVVGFGVTDLVVWEVLAATAGLIAHVVVARRMLPGLRILPSMSLAGMREIIGYSMFSFLTHIFLMVYRESGRLILGNRLGTASVAYLGTPDSVSYRVHMIIVSGIETLVPKFSASRDAGNAKTLLIVSTWATFACAAIVYVPIAVLMPEFLRLWISPEFARESGEVGRLLTLGLIGSAVFSPIATYYRGRGQPAFVTGVMVVTGLVVLVGALALTTPLGVAGVGYAYFAAAGTWIGGLCVGWQRLYGRDGMRLLARVAGPPLALAAALGFAQASFVTWWGEPGWVGLIVLGATFGAIGAVAVVSLDLVLGGMSSAAVILERLLGADRLARLKARMPHRTRAVRS